MTARARLLGLARVLVLGALLVGLIGLFRLSRQFPAAAATPGLLIPFLQPVLALALEAGGLIALSGAVLGAVGQASFAERLRASALPLVAVGAIWSLAAALPRGTERPGSLANDLIAHAQAGCEDAVASVPVPLLGLAVKCAPPRRIEGPMPGVAAVQLVMRELSFSEDLRRVRIEGLELTAKRSLRVHLTAGTAQIAGLAPWTRSPQLPTFTRLLVLGGVGAVIALAACSWLGSLGQFLVTPAEPARVLPAWRQRLLNLRRALLLGAPGVAAAAVVIILDQQRASVPLYGLAGVAAIAALVALRLLARYAPKSFSSFGNF